MTEKIIPADVEKFLLKHIDSVAEWEGLLLLRAHPATEWDAQTVARNLYVTEQEAAQLLTNLAAKGFLAVAGETVRYRYQVAQPKLETEVARAADLYKRRLIPITNLIHSKAKKRIQAFADAFRIRKD